MQITELQNDINIDKSCNILIKKCEYKFRRITIEKFVTLNLEISSNNDFKLKVIVNTGGKITLNVTNLLSNNQNLKQNIEIVHLGSNSQSSVISKNALNKNAQLDFNGLIKVGKDVKNIISRMENSNLILDSGITVNTEPKLEISSKSVKCYHSSSNHQINQDQVNYLRSRAIDEKIANKMIVESFLTI